ncbi:hypothetical protein NEMBOFW57_001812 [Staphylotrichum longicolle]|uniref:Uncharacterized protein n=1 Tax=Staphylotrichum longicolle TaxID=669026 RepID=A0AAD4F265_9PEZI|nr:hypothetical protein NEMBOFW57_001812 [Staphylotrichum longicolle]
MATLPAVAHWEGGPKERAMLQAAASEAHIAVHGPPDFPFNAEILGVCGVPAEMSDENKYGWMVADFLHWKLLFHGVGYKTAQTWLSSLDVPEFLESVDNVDLINDGTIDKVKQDIAPLPNNNEEFMATFLKHLAASAKAAATKKTVLVLMVFAPITPEQDICIDFGGKRTYLTVDNLCKTVNDAVGNAQTPIMFITPSPFSGGWLCRPSLTNQPGSPTLHNMMRIIAKSCGGAFANRFIRSFTERDTPLMTEAQREQVKYDDPMPLHPTKLQTDCLHQFQRQIHEALEQRLSVLAKSHGFILGPDAVQVTSNYFDAWMDYGPRQSRPLAWWTERWGSPRPTIADPHRFDFLGEAFGGTKESQFFHLKYLAAVELDTCPGDWARQVGGITRDLLTTFSQRLMVGDDDAKRVFDAIEFRSSSMIVAHMIAKAFNLPLPDGVKCRYWHDKLDGVGDEYYRKLQFAFGEAHNLFDQATLLPSEKRHEYKNVRFWRAARWLSAAIALRFENGTRQDIESFVLMDVAKFIAKIRDAQKTLLLEHKAVTQAGMNWIAALGLGGEVESMVVPTVTPELKVIAKDAKDSGLATRNHHGPTAKTTVLDAQATPWPAPNSHSVSRQNDWNKAGEPESVGTKSAMNPLVVAYAEENNLTQSDVQHAVQDVLEDLGSHFGTDTKQVGAQSPPVNVATTPLTQQKDKKLDSTNNTAHSQKVPATTATSDGVEGNATASLVTNNNAENWNQAVDAYLLSRTDQKKPTINGSTASGARRKADVPLASNSAWEDALNTKFPTKNNQETKNTQVASLEPSADLVGRDEKKTGEQNSLSKTVVAQVATPHVAGEKAAPTVAAGQHAEPSKTAGEDSESSNKAAKQVASPNTTPASQPPVQPSIQQLTESMLAGVNNGGMSSEVLMCVTQLLQKVMEIAEKEKASKPSDQMNGTQVAGNTSSSVTPNGNVAETSASSTEPRITSAENHADSSGPANEADKVEEASASLTGGASTASSDAFGASPKATADHARMASLDARMQSLTIHDGVPNNASAMGHGDEASGESVKDGADVVAVQPAVAQGTTGPNQARLAADADDFWARARINW